MLNSLQVDYLKAIEPVLAILQKGGMTAQVTEVPTGCYYLTIIEKILSDLGDLVTAARHAKQVQCAQAMLDALKKRFKEDDVKILQVL